MNNLVDWAIAIMGVAVAIVATFLVGRETLIRMSSRTFFVRWIILGVLAFAHAGIAISIGILAYVGCAHLYNGCGITGYEPSIGAITYSTMATYFATLLGAFVLVALGKRLFK